MIFYFDEMNKLNTAGYKRRSMDYEKYFGEMPISDEEKEKRINVAKKLELVATTLFMLVPIYAQNEIQDRQYLISEFARNYKNAIKEEIVVDEKLGQYIDKISESIVTTTFDRVDVENENYYTSDDRAMFIAENEANMVCNYEELEEALLMGCTQKRWISIDDKHTRHTHVEANGQVVDITEPFEVGDSLLMFPKDESLGADSNEIVGCRCCAEYE